jgi:rhodanese-related sulfurtransferase
MTFLCWVNIPADPELSLGLAMAPPSSLNYAGDVTAAEAWDRLKSDPKAQLLDVRTMAEWNFVGVPDLSSIGRDVHCVEWQSFPTGAMNPDFVEDASQVLEDRQSEVMVICRSGARSRAAAIALTQAGFTRAFNVAGGFEGNTDGEGHRGNVDGWKANNLPWRQG